LDNGCRGQQNWGGTGGGTNTARVQAEHGGHRRIENEPQRAAQVLNLLVQCPHARAEERAHPCAQPDSQSNQSHSQQW
jgi:hypothetical protein